MNRSMVRHCYHNTLSCAILPKSCGTRYTGRDRKRSLTDIAEKYGIICLEGEWKMTIDFGDLNYLAIVVAIVVQYAGGPYGTTYSQTRG